MPLKQRSGTNNENLTKTPLDFFIYYLPFAVICAFLFFAPIIPDIKLTRPKLLLTETCLYGALYLWLAANLFFGKLKIRKSIFNVPVFLYALSVAVFYYFSPDKPVALNELKRSLLSLTAYVVFSNIIDSTEKRNIALSFMMGGSFVAVSYGILQHYGGIGWIQVPQFARCISTFGNPIFFAAYLVITLPIIASLTFYVQNKYLKTALCCFFAAGIVALYFTQTRAAFIGFGVSAVVYILLSIKSRIKKITFIAALAIALSVFAITTKDMWSRQQAHTLIWRDTLTMWAHQPLFGTGPGTFHIYFPQYASKELRSIWPEDQSIINDAHNEYIQYLSETGIVGFGVFLWLLAAFFKNALSVKKNAKTPNENYLISGFIAAAAGILTQNLFSVDMRFIISSVYLFSVAGFIETFRDDHFIRDGISKSLRATGLIACAVIAVLTFQKMLEPYLAQNKVATTPDFFDEKILEPAKTISDLEGLAAKYPSQALIYEKLGWVYSKEKNWRKAVENFSRSSELNPKKAGPLNNLGNIYFLLGDRANAIKYWTRSIEINPNQVDSRLNLALAYYYKGKLKEASDQLREVLKIDPHNEKAIVMLKQMTE